VRCRWLPFNLVQRILMSDRTESKATTVWSVPELSRSLPSLVKSVLRTSRYYSRRNDTITIQAQTQRSRSANRDENHKKLSEELLRLYRERVPGETSEKKAKKYKAL
jgi:peptidyl-tRNA hydrolase ICT1